MLNSLDGYKIYYGDEDLPTTNDYKTIRADDLAWILIRLNVSSYPEQDICQHELQTIPSWMAFNSILTDDSRPVHIVGFLPVLPFPITKYETVYYPL